MIDGSRLAATRSSRSISTSMTSRTCSTPRARRGRRSGVEITHRAVGINLLQMILSIDLLDRNTHGVSWLPLYHDMGLSMIGFPAVYGGHSTLMSPTAFIRRPQRWIRRLGGRVAAGTRCRHRGAELRLRVHRAAWPARARRGCRPEQCGDDHRFRAGQHATPSTTFNAAFEPYGLPPTAIEPSYGIAEATLFVSTIAPDRPTRQSRTSTVERPCTRSGRTRRGGRPERRRSTCRAVSGSQPGAVIVDPDRKPSSPTGGSARSGCTATTPAAILGSARGVPADVRRRRYGRRLAVGQATLTAHPPAQRGCGPGISGATSTASCTSPAGVPGSCWSTAARITRRTSRPRRRRPRRSCGGDTSRAFAHRRKRCRDRIDFVAERAPGDHAERADPVPAAPIATPAAAIAGRVQRHGSPSPTSASCRRSAIPRTTSGKVARRACRADICARV